MTKKERAIYLAALLEGEGCFRVRRRGVNATSIAIELKMTDKDVMEWVAELMCGFVHSEVKVKPAKERIIGRKPIWELSLCNQKALVVMKEILPFMGLRRSAKIRLAIDRYETRVTWGEASRRAAWRKKRCLTTLDLF